MYDTEEVGAVTQIFFTRESEERKQHLRNFA